MCFIAILWDPSWSGSTNLTNSDSVSELPVIVSIVLRISFVGNTILNLTPGGLLSLSIFSNGWIRYTVEKAEGLFHQQGMKGSIIVFLTSVSPGASCPVRAWSSVDELTAGGPAGKSELNQLKDNRAQVGVPLEADAAGNKVHCGIRLRRLDEAAWIARQESARKTRNWEFARSDTAGGKSRGRFDEQGIFHANLVFIFVFVIMFRSLVELPECFFFLSYLPFLFCNTHCCQKLLDSPHVFQVTQESCVFSYQLVSQRG